MEELSYQPKCPYIDLWTNVRTTNQVPARGTLARKNELKARRTSIIGSDAPHPAEAFPYLVISKSVESKCSSAQAKKGCSGLAHSATPDKRYNPIGSSTLSDQSPAHKDLESKAGHILPISCWNALLLDL